MSVILLDASNFGYGLLSPVFARQANNDAVPRSESEETGREGKSHLADSLRRRPSPGDRIYREDGSGWPWRRHAKSDSNKYEKTVKKWKRKKKLKPKVVIVKKIVPLTTTSPLGDSPPLPAAEGLTD